MGLPSPRDFCSRQRPRQAAMLRQGVLLLLLCWAVGAQEQEDNIRLPGHVVPTRYRLDVVTHLEGNFTFHGKVWVDVEARRETERLTLHSKGLTLDQKATRLIELSDPGANSTERRVKLTAHEEDAARHFLILHLATPLRPGARYRLLIVYSGTLADNLTGFYRLSYSQGNSSETRWMAATVFEPVEARRAFPCFDEPALKARYQLNLARLQDMSTISNMPVRVTEPMAGRPGWVWDRYAESPLMSSYLVAWVVGALGYREAPGEHAGGRPTRVWARPEALEHAHYALSVAPRMAQSLADYVRLADPLPKTDLVALPSFVSDALENWGVISFGERYLLHQPGETSTSSKEYTALIIAHELAHTWFGNLVTLDWWDAIWLNEGFATYFSAIAVEQVEPDFEIHTSTAVKAFLQVFSMDSLRSSHALTAAAAKTSQLYEIFDSITYYKGYYLLRMLNHSLGEPTFRSAVARYVADHQYSSVGEDDLWAVLTEQARGDGVPLPPGKDVKELMGAWSSLPGYPVVTVLRNYTAGTADITQARFLRAKGDLETRTLANESAGWWVPLTFTAQQEPLLDNCTRPRLWLDPAQRSTQLRALPGADSWLLFNLHATALYRVNYDRQNWLLLADALDSDQLLAIPVLNRALLLDDAMDLARADLLAYSVALNLSRYLARERHYLPWRAAYSNMDYLGRMLRSGHSAAAFQRFMLRLVSTQFEELGFEPRPGEKAMVKLHRKQIAKWACSVDHPGCVERAMALFHQWRGSNYTSNPIPVDVRGVIFCTAIAHGSADDWDFLWASYLSSNRSSERAGMLAALGCSKDPQTLSRFLSWSIQTDSGVKKQHSAAVFEAVAKNPVGHAVARAFLKNNIDAILTYIGPNSFHLPKLLMALAYMMNRPDHLKELRQFQMNHMASLRAASRSLDQANEMVQFNIDWLQRNYLTIAHWLEDGVNYNNWFKDGADKPSH